MDKDNAGTINTGKFHVVIEGNNAADAQRLTRDFVTTLKRQGASLTVAKFETLGVNADSNSPAITDYLKDVGASDRTIETTSNR